MLKNKRLKLALPSPSSRFFPDIASFLKLKGIDIQSQGKQLSKIMGNLEILFLRGFDIPFALTRGWIDIGITGLDAFYEANGDGLLLGKLGIRYSEVVFASKTLSDVKCLQPGNCIVSEYKRITRDFLLKKRLAGINVTNITGAAESYGNIQDVAGLITLKTTGQSLVDNHLQVLETIFETQACLLAGPTAISTKYSMINDFADLIGLSLESVKCHVNSVGMAKLSNI